MLEFYIKNQTMERIDKNEPATDSVNYLQAKFTFATSDWYGYIKVALFRLGNKSYKATINSKVFCNVPHEVLKATADTYSKLYGNCNKVYVTVYGNSGSARVTTNELLIQIKPSGYTEGENSEEPTPDIYAQFVEQFRTASEEVSKAAIEVKETESNYRNLYANALKGSVSGEVIRIDDVMPFEHTANIKAHGKNLIPYPYSDTTKTVNGITYTDNGDGSITANGTATDNAVFYFTNVGDNFYIDGKVSLSGCPRGGSVGGTGYSIRLNHYVDGKETSGIVDTGEGKTGEFNNALTRVYFVVLAGGTVENLVIRPMLEYGETVTEYAPYVDPTTVTVTRCGANILPLTTFTFTPNTSTATFTNGVLTVTGYIAAHRVSATGLIGKTLTISCESSRSGEKGGGLAIEFRDATNTRISGVYKQNELSPTFTFTVPKNTANIVVFFYASGSAEDTGTATYKKIQLEHSTIATAYEAYKEIEPYTPNADGTCEVVSLSPTMTLYADTEGVTIDCEYKKDTNKVIENLVNAVIALGGNL